MERITLQVDCPKEVRRELKVQAASEDKTLTDWVLDVLKEALKQSDKKRRFP